MVFKGSDISFLLMHNYAFCTQKLRAAGYDARLFISEQFGRLIRLEPLMQLKA